MSTSITPIKIEQLNNKEAVKVIKLIYKFQDVLVEATNKNEPSILSRFLIDLGQAFSSFYNEHHIIDENKQVQDARLALTNACGITLKIGANLLGIEMPDRM